ncbi:MAG TPA: hypothetical protein PKH37_02750, partial [Alphaproteobacteria bacterium]|nr:hypothetical protein [Alphaproteobacteria bacterium]
KHVSPLIVYIATLPENQDRNARTGKPKLKAVDQAVYSVHEKEASNPFILVDDKNDMRFVFAVAVGKAPFIGNRLDATNDQAFAAAKYLVETVSPDASVATVGATVAGREGFQEHISTNYEVAFNRLPLWLQKDLGHPISLCFI